MSALGLNGPGSRRARPSADEPNRTLGRGEGIKAGIYRSLKSASRLAKGLTAAGVGIASTAIIGLYWN